MSGEIAVYQGPAVRALFKQLVRDFGGVDAVAALLGCAKGTISREVNGGLPVQDRDLGRISAADLKVVTRRAPTEQELRDLLFAWRVAKFVKSTIGAKG